MYLPPLYIFTTKQTMPTADSPHRSPSHRWQLRTPGCVVSQVRHGTGGHLCWHLGKFGEMDGWDIH